ncbi:MAG: TolC family protein [Bacteroidales bacterium]|nr:TolC family protein [Bacteroidales bacterium]MCF8454838.1 TolC family protein [Bacteroidales bacterium]
MKILKQHISICFYPFLSIFKCGNLFPLISKYFKVFQNISKYFYLFLFISISFSVSAQGDLQNYLQTAAENNPGLKMKFNEYMAALEVGPQAKALPDPQVAFGYFIQPVETRVGPMRVKISASQMFPWFGTLKTKEYAAIQLAKAKYEAFEEAKSKLFHDIRTMYFNIYINQKAIEITMENLDLLGSFRKLANIKVESGLVSAVDEYRIEIEIGELENQLAYLKDKEQVLQVMFSNLLNTDKIDQVSTPKLLWNDDFPLTKQEALDSINRMNHQLLSLDMQQEALRLRQEVASDMGKPTFMLGFDYTVVGKGENNMAGTDALVFPMVGITIPLYRNKYKAMVEEVVYMEAAKENEKLEKTNMLESLFENGWKDYVDANRRITLYISQLNLAKISVKLLETDYATGNKNFEEILRMERKQLKFNLELEKARADKQAAISFIYYLMGK